MKERVSQISAHLELELGEEFSVLTNRTTQFVYSTENMDMLKQTFKKVHELLVCMDYPACCTWSVCVVSMHGCCAVVLSAFLLHCRALSMHGVSVA